ncbi:hypothetical protein ACN2WE_14720 [Streptomyces sp. cg28]|uniref:Uncharacterized protein n=1 Tax=Streptomyces tabacisoli TaxID=3156398 RepID=A0AAU8IT31_9ACTN|nr:hypothetical protein [Streptomyces sp. PsTaAH-137]MYT71317.1 hypothetical protein [Streptomyces sp. SID8367]RAJ82771.1 hypothetical protein K377_03821 [Streptomyces sp. PsTaAH-137]
MAASAQLLLSALSKQADPVLSVTDPLTGIDTLSGTDTTTSSFEAPLTSEPAFADYAPLTSEPPLSDELPLTSEPTPSGLAAG